MRSELLVWFWSEFDDFQKNQSELWHAPPVQERTNQYKNWQGMCQCETERFITGSDDPKKMRAFYMLAVFLDQMVYTHFPDRYSRFHEKFPLPKLFAHLSPNNYAGPNWFIYTKRRWDNKINWSLTKKVAEELFGDFYTWLESLPCGKKKIVRFREFAKIEMKNTFEVKHYENVTKVLDL